VALILFEQTFEWNLQMQNADLYSKLDYASS